MGGTAIEVPDRELKCWVPNNPKEYERLFEVRCRHQLVLMEKATPQAVPDPIPSDEKPPLKRAVQLWKRQRDIVFSDVKGAPSSILLTTLAAEFYNGEMQVVTALANILNRVSQRMRAEWPRRIAVLNPTNVDEDLCARYSDDEYRAIVRWVASLNQRVTEISALQGLEKIAAALKTLFGESVTVQAVKALMEKLATASNSSSLKYGRAGLSAGTATVGLAAVPRHHFFGDD
jgi:hypothetical protein